MDKTRKVGVWMVMAAGILFIAASPARADERIVANVPFEFVAGHSHLPAGEYVVTEESESGVVSVISKDGRHIALFLTIPDASANEPGPDSDLVFERIGDEHFLSRIVVGGELAREVPLTPAQMERQLSMR